MDTLTAKPPTGAKPQDGLPPEQRRWAVAAIFAALAMGSLDTVIANIALPAMAADLHVSPAEIVWVINVYQIVIVATVLPLGALGEIVGHQRIYLGGLLLFTLASLGCALAWSLPSLLVARTLQGHARAQRVAVLVERDDARALAGEADRGYRCVEAFDQRGQGRERGGLPAAGVLLGAALAGQRGGVGPADLGEFGAVGGEGRRAGAGGADVDGDENVYLVHWVSRGPAGRRPCPGPG